MRKFLLFIGVVINCLLFSCTKDSEPLSPTPPPVIDSFLLHPPTVLDSLPLPFTIGSWWKYQRLDSSLGGNPVCCVLKLVDSSIELITVIGKTPYVFTVNEIKNNSITRTRFDTINAFMLELKNLTKGKLDTIYSYYYNASFRIFNYSIKIPIVEGTKSYYIPYTMIDKVKKDTSVTVLNKRFDNCIYGNFNFTDGWPHGYNGEQIIFIEPGIGAVYYRDESGSFSQYTRQSDWYIRRLMDYHIVL